MEITRQPATIPRQSRTPRHRMARCGIAQLSRLVVFGLTSLIATLPAAAGPFVPSVVAGFGPAVAAGEGSESLKSGQSFLLNALARRQHGNCWILQASYE